ncbi:ATP-binding protein [Chloroflexota bacterium]
MELNLYETEAEINAGYEAFQIIRDFDNPIQIFREAFQNSLDESATEINCNVYAEKRLGGEDLFIDISDNGLGLTKDNIPCFFGLAKSTKVTSDLIPTKGKIGYKGHGTKIYFNSESVEIYSKPDKNKAGWGIKLTDPIHQIENKGNYFYSQLIPDEECSMKLPSNYDTGFYIRIKNPHLFKTQHERYMLNHLYLRDYSKWYTVFGNIRNIFNAQLPNISLYLKGLNVEFFKEKYSDAATIDPIPTFVERDSLIFEVIQMGHYFPPDRKDDASMKAYVKKIGSSKQYYDYYSRQIYRNTVSLENGVQFNFVINVEGRETKSRYDILLSQRGTGIERNLQHTDGERYGLWACKGGVPIEKVDEWIVGGRGIGAYTYMHAFIDCDAFDLTANRGSVKNTDLEILSQVREKITAILNSKPIETALKERVLWEDFEKTQRSINEDSEELKDRYKTSLKKRYIQLANGERLPEPSSAKTGYSESETLMLLLSLTTYYPDLFKFKVLDYNTTKGIDFVVEMGSNPRYIELKGTFRKTINHSFRNIYKFICYDLPLTENDVVEDIEPIITRLRINEKDKFESFDERFNNKEYKSYTLIPDSAGLQSMEVIVLKQILFDVLGATWE